MWLILQFNSIHITSRVLLKLKESIHITKKNYYIVHKGYFKNYVSMKILPIHIDMECS